MEKLVLIEAGQFWFINKSKNKFNLTKFAISNFDDLKKVFKFSKQNFILQICNYKIKKLNYNFYINNKKVKKVDVIKILEKCKKEF